MKRLLLLLPLALTACQSAEERKTEYMAFCTTHEFSHAQCEVLYLNKQSSDNAAMQAASSQIMSGAAMGMAAGMSGGRR